MSTPDWCVFILVLCGLVYTLAGCDATTVSENANPDIREEQVVETMRSVREYQLAQLPDDRKLRGWSHCTFYAGMMAAYRATGDRAYLDSSRVWAEKNEWTLGWDTPRDANDHCVGQVYAELFFERADSTRIAQTKGILEELIDRREAGTEIWDWADALFMAPPALVRLGRATGQSEYFDFAAHRFQEASKPLFDSGYGLYYRDTRFTDWRADNGEPVFWSRGNGWVVAGIARVLQHLPQNHPARPWFEKRFRTMAISLASKQQESGYWHPSLMDPNDVPSPETSGTGLFCYAFAWGINTGILDREQFAPTVRKAWRALERSVNSRGRLGWVQSPHSRPAPVSEEDSFPYGSGALLLAGSQTLRMLRESDR